MADQHLRSLPGESFRWLEAWAKAAGSRYACGILEVNSCVRPKTIKSLQAA